MKRVIKFVTWDGENHNSEEEARAHLVEIMEPKLQILASSIWSELKNFENQLGDEPSDDKAITNIRRTLIECNNLIEFIGACFNDLRLEH